MSKQARLRKAHKRLIKTFCKKVEEKRMGSADIIREMPDFLGYDNYFCKRMRTENYRGILTFKRWKKQ